VVPTGGTAKGARALWRVRVARGPTEQHEYVWSSEESARRFAASLDSSMHAEVVDPGSHPARPADPSSPAPEVPTSAGRYWIRVATSARRQLKDVPSTQWHEILQRLVELARACGESRTPSHEALTAAGIEPPYLRVNAGEHLVVCDADPGAHAVTVLHVLPAHGHVPHPSATAP
jgi:hypothetical protein